MISPGSELLLTHRERKNKQKNNVQKIKREQKADLNACSVFMPQQLITLIRLVMLAAVIRALVCPLTKNHSSQKSSIKCTEPLLTKK